MLGFRVSPTEEAGDAAKPERLILYTIEKSEIEKEVGLPALARHSVDCVAL